MRFLILPAVAALHACGSPSPAPAGEAPSANGEAPSAADADAPVAATLVGLRGGASGGVRTQDGWQRSGLLCDAVDAPVTYVLAGDDDAPVLVALPHDGRQTRPRTLQPGATSGDPPTAIDFTIRGGGEGRMTLQNAPGQGDGAAALPSLAELALPEGRVRCRAQPGTRFIGVTTNRTILIAASPGLAPVFRAFDHGGGARTGTAATLTLTGGTADPANARWMFESGGSRYRIEADRAGGGAMLTIDRPDRPVGREPFLAYSVAAVPTTVPDRVTARFACDRESFTVDFDNRADTATIRFEGGARPDLRLDGRRPASGIWYSDEGWELRGKGDQATLTGGGGGVRTCRAIDG